MGSVQAPIGPRDGQIESPPTRPQLNHFEVDALRQENKQLRELVVQLSEIVVRNVLERK
jgi:hypothetical protein